MAEAKAPVSKYLTADSCETRHAHGSLLESPGCSVPVPCLEENPQRMYSATEKISSDTNAVIIFPDFARNIIPATARRSRAKYSALF